MGDIQKPQRPRKREEEIGLRRHDWKDWEKSHNHLTGLSNNKLFHVYQQNENERVRSHSKIQAIDKDIDKMEKFNRKQIQTLREDYKVMMSYAYVYKLHSMGQDPDNDDLPLIRKRLKVQPAQTKPKDPDIQNIPDGILEYYDERPKSFKLPSVAPKWRPASFSGNPFKDNQTPNASEPWINDPYPTLKEDDIVFVKKDKSGDHTKGKGELKDTFTKLPAIGTFALKLGNWESFGNKNTISNKEKPKRNAMSEPPSRWRGRETTNKFSRPKSFIPGNDFSCRTISTTKKFYDEEAKKALPKLTASHKRLKETQKLLEKISNPLNEIIESKKTTSAILKEYRQKRQEVKKGPVRAFTNNESDDKPKTKIFQNWIVGKAIHDVNE